MRALCKSIINKNWGKLAQRDNLSKTEYITKPADYFALISDQSKTVKHVNICREEMLLVNWEDSTAFVQPHDNSKVVVAAHVTSQARLHLYKWHWTDVYFILIRIRAFTFINLMSGTQKLSIIGEESGKMNYRKLKLLNLWGWDQKIMATNT